MHNFTRGKNIPLHLPVAVTIGLRPWFDADTLEKGLSHIRKAALSQFFFHRHAAAALFQDEFPLTIVYEKTSRIRQGFTIKTQHCRLCGASSREKRCEHIAALCLLSLVQEDGRPPFPMPLLFRESLWGKIAGFLHDWMSAEKGSLTRSSLGEQTRLKRTASEGEILAHLSDSTARVWEIFDQEKQSHAIPSAISKLYLHVLDVTLSDSERVLRANGTASRAFTLDSSLWSRLCRLFYALAGEVKPILSHDKISGLFILEFQNKETCDLLKIHLPRHRTQEILGQLDLKKEEFPILPPARQGFQVRMNKEGQIVVSPIIRLADQRLFLLSEISHNKYGKSYFFPGEGFLPLKNQDVKGKITQATAAQSSNPLFDFLNNDTEFVVDENELLTFVAENKTALSHPDNMVAAEIFKLQIKVVPDSLIIHDFQEDQDWYYLSCDYGLGNKAISLEEVLATRAKKDALYSGTTSLQLKHGPLSWFYKLAPERQWTDNSGRRGVRLSPSEFISFISSVEDVQSRLNDDCFHNRLETILDHNSWSDPARISQVPSHLRDYQKNGLAWLHTLYDLKLGGLLADDMGLGKTHQGLALLEMIGRKKGKQAMLVICPASVLPHWRDKIDTFYPSLNYSLYHGANRNLEEALQTGLLLTTYGTARSDQEHLMNVAFEIILLDEMQNVKNRNTSIHKAVSSFRCRVKFGLSGTPIENSLADLYALFDICLPNFFGTMEQYNKTYLKPITEQHDKEQSSRLSRLVEPFILRRSRAQVLTELPDLIEDNRTCELSEDQVTLYRETIDNHHHLLGELESTEERINYLNILAIITRLKQICNHPCLVAKQSDPSRYKSGKWDLFVELLHECLGSGLKVVVFSQYTGMLDIMKHYLEGAGIEHAELRGSMSVTQRARMIDTFTKEKSCSVFCSSLLAGGTGIDLQAGQAVIHYDRWWNPAKEEQATARVHRMGQKDVVQLFRLITSGTLEEKIHTIIAKKQNLASAIINEDEAGIIKQLDRRQLVELFRS